jgi:hypothetical protein
MLDKDDPWLKQVTDSDVVDPLSEVARKERTALMVSNLLLFAVVQVGIVPTKFSALGMESDNFNPAAVKFLVWVLGAGSVLRVQLRPDRGRPNCGPGDRDWSRCASSASCARGGTWREAWPPRRTCRRTWLRTRPRWQRGARR